MNGKLVSPNELFDRAKQDMLGGREPVSVEDWKLIVLFWAYNIQAEVAPPTIRLFGILYDCPLSVAELNKISALAASEPTQ